MCLMNLFLHNIGELDGEPAVQRSDALITEPQRKGGLCAGQPALWQKSSMTITNEEGEEDREALTYERQDFGKPRPTSSSIFAAHRQHAQAGRQGGRGAADNVLFEGGRARRSGASCWKPAMHTVLRPPTGIFTPRA